jgi:type I restriction enzyme S subunit
MFTSQLADFVFPLPPLAEQRRIVAEVERRLSVVSALEATVAANLRRAERLRQSILKRAFEGKLVAQDASDEPARALLERIGRTRESGVGSRGPTAKGGGRHGRPKKSDAVGAGLVPARNAANDRPLPANDPVRGAAQLGLEGME